jgi:serine/threonine protein kinase
MPEAATTRSRFLDYLRKSGLVDPGRLESYLRSLSANGPLPEEPNKVAACFIRDGLLTNFQAQQLLRGRYRNFLIGKYKVLEPLGAGGMSKVYLCEHQMMRRRVALKLLPVDRIGDASSVGRFHREARAVAALDHPNIVRAHDIDSQGDKLLYLIMDYVEGVNLHDLVKKRGPLEPAQAANYICQAAAGLQHITEAGLVHRDIKPGNLLLDRFGTVKILDLGLARFQDDRDDNITRNYDNRAILGTADYISPEQALRSSHVDIRADIYSLGATFYFLLTGQAPFESSTVAQKLLNHQMKPPKPVTEHRPDLPAEMVAVVEKMMAKSPDGRYQQPREVMEALAPWSGVVIPPPDAADLPQLSPAAQRAIGSPSSTTGPTTPSAGLSSTIHPAPVITPTERTPVPPARKSSKMPRRTERPAPAPASGKKRSAKPPAPAEPIIVRRTPVQTRRWPEWSLKATQALARWPGWSPKVKVTLLGLLGVAAGVALVIWLK